MFLRLSAFLREQLDPLVVQYDERLRTVPGYANLPEAARHDLERHVLQLMADCLEANDDSRLIQYVHDRAEQVLTHGFQPEWFQQAVTIPQEIIIALVETVEESNFVWRSLGHAQATVWDIVARERHDIELTLRESEARYQTIFDATPIMFWLKDTHNRTLRINKAAAEFEGVKQSDVEGKSAYDLYPREQAEAYYQDDLEVIRSNQPKLGIVEQHTSVGTGKLMWVETGKTPVHDDHGQVVGVLAFGIDVSERQQAEAKLREGEEQYRRAITAAGAVPYYIDYATESYRFIGEAIEALTGYTINEITPTLLGQMIQETIMTGQGRQLSREEAIQQARAGDLAGWNADYRLVNRSGQTYWLNDASVQVLNEQGQPIGAIGILQDVTERKRLEHEFQASLEQRSRQVQTSIEVAQHIAAAPQLEELFHRVVTLIKERFGYYHVQLFRYESAEDAVKLITGYGEIGQKMLAGGHKLAMGRGVVGTAAATGQSILAADVARDLDWRPNPNLPNTRGELAVPIKLGSGDAESQINALQYFVNGSYDGIAIAAIDPAAVAHITHESLQRGKPVVAVSTDLGQDNQSALVFAVEHELGYLLGVQAGTWAKQHLSGGQDVKLGMLNYRTLPQVLQREMGIIDGIKSVVGEHVTIVASGSAAESKEAAYLTEGWLRDHPDLNMIVAYNDATALGAYQAAQIMGRHDSDQFFIGGIDAVPEALAAIQQGGVYQATVNQPPEIMGVMAVRTLVATIKGIAVKPVNTLYCTPVNRSNVAMFTGPSREKALLVNQDIIPAETLSGVDVSDLRLGLSVLTLANPFFATLVESARQEAQRLGVHLVVHDPSRVLGVLDVQSDQPNSLTDDDRLLLEGLCGQIASAMESTRLLDTVQRSEQLMRTLIDAIPDYIYAKDLQGRHILGNAALARLHGLASTAELLGKTDFDFYSHELAEQYQTSETAILGDGQSLLAHEEPNVGADGKKRWNSTTKVPLRDPAGQIIGLVGITGDITQRKQIELDLRKFKLGLDRSMAAIFITDTNGIITYVNPAFEKVYGFTRDEAIGQTPRIIKSGLIPQEQYQRFWGALLAGETVAGEIINRAKDGRLVPIQGSNSSIQDEQGNILGFLALHNDITERKRAEEVLRRSEAELSTALQIAKLGYWEYDVEKDLFLFNDHFYSIFHTTAEREGGYQLSSAQYAQKFVHPDDLPVVGSEIERALSSTDRHYSRQLEHRILYADGGVGYISVSINIDRDEQGHILRYYGANQDITDRKRIEQQMEETLRETERLYAAVSHEGWQTYRQTSTSGDGYLFDQALVQPADEVWEPEIAKALEQQTLATSQAGQRAVAVAPLSVRGEAIGALGVYDDPASPLGNDDLQLIEAVSEQVALALESARLFDQTQRDAEREHTINRVTSRIRNARSVDEVLSIAAQELRLATQASRSVVEILPTGDQSARAGEGRTTNSSGVLQPHDARL